MYGIAVHRSLSSVILYNGSLTKNGHKLLITDHCGHPPFRAIGLNSNLMLSSLFIGLFTKKVFIKKVFIRKSFALKFFVLKCSFENTVTEFLS